MKDPAYPSLFISQGILVRPETKEVFIQQRPGNKKRPLLWEYPGGKVDEADFKYGEELSYKKMYDSIKATLIRELDEELGIKYVKIDCFISEYEYKVKDNATIYLFAVKDWVGDIKPTAARDTKWVDLYWAIDYMPMSPVIYDSYRRVMAYLED